MKKGVILYVTGRKEDVFSGSGPDLSSLLQQLGVQRIHLATSEDEISDGWWRMVAQGVQEVCCLRARYNPIEAKLEPEGRSMRLCG
jgi:hypothetical protein